MSKSVSFRVDENDNVVPFACQWQAESLLLERAAVSLKLRDTAPLLGTLVRPFFM